MNARCDHQFGVVLFRGDKADPDQHLITVAINVDWQPALECACFEAARRRAGRELIFSQGAGRIEPCWHEQIGRPYVGRVRVLPGGDGVSAPLELPATYFSNFAQAAARQLVQQGKLADGDRFCYLVCAQPRGQGAPSSAGGTMTVEAVEQLIVLQERSIDQLQQRSRPSGPSTEGVLPVFIPEAILQQTERLARQAGTAETGGVLIGYLCRDGQRGEVFLQVTAQIPARLAKEEATRLTFTPATWTDVDTAIALRRRGEIYVGWWHSHPARQWCKDCPPEKRAKCTLTGEFFSTHDIALHRSVFPRAYSVALVVSDSVDGGVSWPLFGWYRGQVVHRGYYVLGDKVVAASGRTDSFIAGQD